MPLSTVICIGMAGSGKTTFMQRLNSHLRSQRILHMWLIWILQF